MIAKEKELGGGGVAPADVPAQAAPAIDVPAQDAPAIDVPAQDAPAIDASSEEETKCGTHLLKAE